MLVRPNVCGLPAADQFAVVQADSVAIVASSPDVRIKCWSWKRSSDASGLDDPTFTVPQSQDTKATKFPLRPGDALYIGSHTFSINVAEDIQVESSALGDVNAAESQYLQSNGQVSIPNGEKSISAGISTPPPLSSHDITIDETPMKSSKITEDADAIVSGVAKNAMQGKENSQTWALDAVSPEVLDIIRDEGRRSQTTPSLPPSQYVENDPPEMERMGCADPQTRRSLSPIEIHHSEPSPNQTEKMVAIAGPSHKLNPTDDDPTDAESVQDDTLDRDTNGAGRLLDEAGSSKRPSSPVETGTPTAAVDSTDINVGGETNGDIARSPYLQKGSKTAKIAVPGTEESQDSMQDAVTMKRRSTTRKSPRTSSRKRATATKEQPVLESTPNVKRTGASRASEEPTSSFKSTRSSVRDGSAEPTSSFRSTRSVARESFGNSQSPNAAMRVVFASSASVDKSKPSMKFLTSQGIRQVQNVADSDILCVGKNTELKRTSNLITAVACGKHVVTDNWVSDSARQGKLLNLKDYEAKDPKRETEWGTTLSDAIERGRQGVKALSDWSICFTPNAKAKLGKGFSEMKDICLQAGAKSIQTTTPNKSPQEPLTTLVIAIEDDKDLDLLKTNGWQAYSKEIITYSILRGNLNFDSDEFSIGQQKPKPNSTSKKRKR